jgi:hypothetical protein
MKLPAWMAGVRQRLFGSPSPQNMLRGIVPGGPSGEPPRIGTREMLEAYESMPWLRAIAGKIAQAIGTTCWRLYAVRAAPAADGKRAALKRPLSLQRAGWDHRQKQVERLRRAGLLEEITDHPFLNAIERPNPFMGRVLLFKITQLHIDLVGDAFWLKERNALGVVTGYWPIPPHWCMELPSPTRPSYRFGWRTWQVYVPENDVRWFHDPAPKNPYTRGSGIGWSLSDELQVDEYAAKMAVQLFFNKARPDFLFMGGEGSSREEMDKLERDFAQRQQGFWKWFRPYFMAGGDGKVSDHIHEFQQPTMEQLVYPSLRTTQRDIAMQTWGVPPEWFGVLENSNRATIEASEYLLAKWVLNPRADHLRDGLQDEFVLEFDERGLVDFVSHVAEDKQYELEVRKAQPAAWLIDEWRALGGGEPLPGGAGQVHLVPSSSYPTEDLMDTAGRQGAPGSSAPPAPATEPPKSAA